MNGDGEVGDEFRAGDKEKDRDHTTNPRNQYESGGWYRKM